jgi:VanZ family protein
VNPRPRVIAAAISVAIYALIFLLSSLPAGSLPSGIPDYIPHFLEYAALAFFLVQVFRRPGQRSAMAAAFLLAALLAILDEWHQRSVPGRVFSLLDWAYDLAGALAGIVAVRFLGSRMARDGAGNGWRWLRIFLRQP